MANNQITSDPFLGFDPSIELNYESSMVRNSSKYTESESQAEFIDFWGMDMKSWESYMLQPAEPDSYVNTGRDIERVSSAPIQNEPLGFNTRQESEAESHVLHENSPAIARLDCHLCMHNFSSEKDRDLHLTHSHGDERPFRCPKPKCEKSFKSKAHVNVHVRNTHDQEKHYVCGHCKHGFFWRWERDRHVKVKHLKIKDFQCEVCGERFAYKRSLQSHMKNNQACKGSS